jgi:type I restriction-modification system DNA methylase subunit
MPRLRRNEWNFSSNAATLITELLAQPRFAESQLGRAEAELTEFRGARRLDLVIFDRFETEKPVITGELKVPWDPLGRTPYNTQVVEDAYRKAGNAGSIYFLTWNIRRAVVWKTDDPGVPLLQRVVYDKEIIPRVLRSQADLSAQENKDALQRGLDDLLSFLDDLMKGPPQPAFLPIDQIFIANLEAALDHPISATVMAVQSKLATNALFRRELEKWMRDVQGWLLAPEYEAENINRAARFSCYVLVNRLCFYNALRRKYDQLPRLTIANNTNTGQLLLRKLSSAFNDAKRFTGDYETVFDGDFGDTLPLTSDESVADWRDLVRLLDKYDFAHLDVDVIGAMYERLITPAERHRYGQHYTQPLIVDLMNAFAITSSTDTILDPGCGGGTFLVGAYKTKATLNLETDHAELLSGLYGCDILHYACHLTTINLAIRNLIDDDNFPKVHRGDFLQYTPTTVFSSQPIRLQAGGLQTGIRQIHLTPESIDAVIGNPPYINARAIPASLRQEYYNSARRAWPAYNWSKSSDIYLYFWLHAAQFLREGSRVVLLTQSGWLDGEFGIPLQEWILDHFEVQTVFESEVEPWFTDARVATCVTVLRRNSEQESRSANRARFIQLSAPLSQIPGTPREIKDAFVAAPEGRNEAFRTRIVRQSALDSEGRNALGHYVGSRWGRYLRAPDTIHALQKAAGNRLVPLTSLASLRRGITTNCDSFFIVADITQEVLERGASGALFRETYGVARTRVEDLSVKIVKRSDGVVFALHSANLLPILKTARNISFLSTSREENSMFAVMFTQPRSRLDRLSLNYVVSGEREEWHHSPSFETLGPDEWYRLGTETASPILFVKTMQYAPFVIWNDAHLLANQRLYQIDPRDGVNAKALCGVMNSVVFAAERYASVKTMGREAAIDVEVFTAAAYRTPDVRLMSEEDVTAIGVHLDELAAFPVAPMLDEAIFDLNLSNAREYVLRVAVSSDNWPPTLKRESRHAIDRICLKYMGVPERKIESTLNRLYDEVLGHTRKLRLLELEAQANRLSARSIADSILGQIVASGQMSLVSVPGSFIADGTETHTILIPARGELRLEPAGLFGSGISGMIGRSRLVFQSHEEAEYVSVLARAGLSGSVPVPTDPHDCRGVTQQIQAYVQRFSDVLDQAASEITSDEDLHRKIYLEGMKAIGRARIGL